MSASDALRGSGTSDDPAGREQPTGFWSRLLRLLNGTPRPARGRPLSDPAAGAWEHDIRVSPEPSLGNTAGFGLALGVGGRAHTAGEDAFADPATHDPSQGGYVDEEDRPRRPRRR